ncbi:MAG TPA: pseudouridine-5'-phosphate glycosidase [Longimicrobiaceae bacterium]
MVQISEEVAEAQAAGRPVVALESTVLAQGLPAPRSLEVGRALEAVVREEGAVPATIAVIDGVPRVGLGEQDLEAICRGHGYRKLSTRDLAGAIARGENGATTVAATSFLASRAGIAVFATGGIGGVHRDSGVPDVSADLTELERTRVLVVCAGAKSILDLPATREALETRGVLVLGWRSDELPAFYSARSGLSVDVRVEEAAEVAAIWRAKEAIAVPGAVLLCVPPPERAALPADMVEQFIAEAMEVASARGITGGALTPFLLEELVRRSGGATLEANVALLLNNARVAARVAVALADR